jgi:hypothetical protein
MKHTHITFQIADLILDTETYKTGLVIKITNKYVHILWTIEHTLKISKWQLINNINIKKNFKYFPKNPSSGK